MPPKRREKGAIEKQVTGDATTSDISPMTMPITPMPAMRTPRPQLSLPTSDHQPPEASYQSPLKKLKMKMQQHERKVIDTIDDLREFIANSDVSNSTVRESIRIKARLLWTTTDTVYNLHFLRLYFGEHQTPESLQQQQREFMQAQQDNPFEANQFLITVSLLNVDPNNPDLPRPGAVVLITPMKLRLYRNCPQVDTKLHGLATIDATP